jgi:hypothetical protein
LGKQIDKVTSNTGYILSNTGLQIRLSNDLLQLELGDMEYFSSLLPKPECINLLDEPQFKMELFKQDAE